MGTFLSVGFRVRVYVAWHGLVVVRLGLCCISVVWVTCNEARDWQPEHDRGYVWVHMDT
jgi:hypothetical protein